jgi:hypothetical protein
MPWRGVIAFDKTRHSSKVRPIPRLNPLKTWPKINLAAGNTTVGSGPIWDRSCGAPFIDGQPHQRAAVGTYRRRLGGCSVPCPGAVLGWLPCPLRRRCGLAGAWATVLVSQCRNTASDGRMAESPAPLSAYLLAGTRPQVLVERLAGSRLGGGRCEHCPQKSAGNYRGAIGTTIGLCTKVPVPIVPKFPCSVYQNSRG